MDCHCGEIHSNGATACMIVNNRTEVTSALQALLLNMTDSFADDFNTLFGTLYSGSAFVCENGCESCYKGVCGLLAVTKESSIAYGKSNFTVDQILTNQIDSTPFISNFTFFLKNCVQYTSGTISDGQLCFGVVIESAAEANSAQHMCNLEYDGVPCNSCVIDLASTDGCYVADCTNIDASAMIDSCSGTGFVGPFVLLGVLRSGNITGSSLTLGSCDVQPTPIAPIAPSPIKAPVASPVEVPATAPTGSPITAAPMKSPSEAPSVVPTTLNGIIVVPTFTGSVSIRLTSTSSDLEGSFAETYLAVCEMFYRDQFSATNVSCAFSARRLHSQKNLSRYLQSNSSESPIDVPTDVTSKLAAGEEIQNYVQALIDAIELNGEQFVLLLKTRGSATSQAYFCNGGNGECLQSECGTCSDFNFDS
jgi:hypothetical protein